MRFAFTSDQVAFREAAHDLLAKECPPEVVRAAWPDGADALGARKGEGARAAEDRSWGALAAMGVLGIAVPDSHDGLGMGPLDWVLLAEETGYAALPRPFVETALVAAPLLAADGGHDDLVARIVAGEALVGVRALLGFVPWGLEAEVHLDVLRRRTWEARLIDARLETLDTVDASRHLANVRSFAGVGGLGDADAAEAAFDRGALATAAQLVGLGRRMVDLTVAYTSERTQFGVPIGSFQAVKHHLADAAKGLRFAAPAVYGAAWSLATDQPTAGRDVSMAKALASDAAQAAGRAALQCHGAIGYTVEADLHLYLKRAEALARAWGGASWHRRRVGHALGL
ncbi:MAG: acyl-CoA dehydrogenase family protein [Iamia sp.]